jgi:serine/threonine-protein kinase
MMAQSKRAEEAMTVRDAPVKDCPVCDILHPSGDEGCPSRRVGRTVAGKYRIDRVIGAGGIGAVYGAVHLPLNRHVALKMLQAQYADDDQLGQRFVRESRQQAAIGHRGIVAVHDAGYDEEWGCFLEMEELSGATVYEIIKKDGPFDVERAVRLAIDMLSTLGAIHAEGIVHRDLKPMNLFVIRDAESEHVKIIDFGLIKVDDGHMLTQTGQVLGTPLYMSAEQLTDPRGVDGRTDLFALGITLFEMLTAKSPVDYKDRADLNKKILHGDMRRHPREVRPEIPEWLDAIVAKAMDHDRANRFTDAESMQQALEEGLAALSARRPWWQRWLGRA